MPTEAEIRREAEAMRDEAYASGAAQTLVCRGRCMVPILQEGAEVVVRRCDPGQLAIGDVVLYRSAEGLMLHRYLRRRRRGDAGPPRLITKADRSARLDEPVDPDRLVGRVVSVDLGGRRIRLDSAPARAACRVIGVFSLAEWVLFAALRRIRRGVFASIEIRQSYLDKARDAVMAPKDWAARLFVAWPRPRSRR